MYAGHVKPPGAAGGGGGDRFFSGFMSDYSGRQNPSTQVLLRMMGRELGYEPSAMDALADDLSKRLMIQRADHFRMLGTGINDLELPPLIKNWLLARFAS